MARDGFFYPILTWIMDSFSCSPLITSFILEKRGKDFQKILNTLRCDMVTSFLHYDDFTDRRATSVRLFVFYLSLGLVRVCEINRIHHWCSVGTEKSQPKGTPFQWEMRLAEFPTERWTRGFGFFWNHWTPMIDSFSHIPRPYGTVLCNICWWRHWGRCLQSMTRAVQIDLKQRINSTLNNEQKVISSKWIYKN